MEVHTVCAEPLPYETEFMRVDQFLEQDYVRAVRSVALACGEVGSAEDAVQHALATALDAERRGRVIENLTAWVVTVAINRTRRRFRRRNIESKALARLAPLQREAVRELDDARLDLRAALAELPLRQRQVVVLYYLHDLDVATIAELAGISAGTVKNALHRGRGALAKALAPDQLAQPEEHHA